MNPETLPNMNARLTSPREDVEDLPVFLGEGTITSAWKPTLKERLQLLFGAHIYCQVLGNYHPPISLFVAAPAEGGEK